MELTLTSALSPSGSLGHAAYLLLVISMMVRRMVLLRIFVIASAIVGVIYSALILTDPVSVFWESLLIAVNVVQLSITAWQNRRARFTAEESAFAEHWFPTLPPRERRALFDQGRWRSAAAGEILCTEHEPVPALSYLASGAAAVTLAGRPVAHCQAGSFIGEITVATGAPASGTVRLSEPARLWEIDAERLRRVLENQPALGRALEACFFRAVRDKLLASNSARLEVEFSDA